MFKKDKYIVTKSAISKDLATYIYNYICMKKQVYDTCRFHNYISPFETLLGFYEGPNEQIPNTYSCYSDIAMETLLLKCQPLMEKITGLKLQPTYTYARLYKKGDVLKRHSDRPSCEISCTLNLGGDPWPIFIDDTGTKTVIDEHKEIHKPNAPKGTKVLLEVGDMLVYSGCELEHWREKFKGNQCGQVFLHYNNKKTKKLKDNIFDKRLHLGLPSDFGGYA